MATSSFDIVISGGGLIGATLALALSRTPQPPSIAIVEAVAPNADHQPSFDSRAIAIAHGSKILLDSYGLWAALGHKATAIKTIHVSDRGHLGKSYLNAEQFGLGALGYVLEVAHLGKLLVDQLAHCANVQWFCPAHISHIDQHKSHLTLLLDDQHSFETKLLLVADGGHSQTRQLLNISNQVTDYQQTAIIANVGLAESHQGRAFERFTKNGPIALLPLTDNRYSLVWCVPPDQVNSMLSWDDQRFLHQLQHNFGYRAGQLTQVGQRFSYPLTLTTATEIVDHRVALVGNSAHTLHPIAGQGFNLGLRDVEALRILIGQHWQQDQDIGSYGLLRQYQQSRQHDLANVVNMTDSLVHLFSNDNKLLALGRTLGLLTLQGLDCLKLPLVNQGMGLSANFQQMQDNK